MDESYFSVGFDDGCPVCRHLDEGIGRQGVPVQLEDGYIYLIAGIIKDKQIPVALEVKQALMVILVYDPDWGEVFHVN